MSVNSLSFFRADGKLRLYNKGLLKNALPTLSAKVPCSFSSSLSVCASFIQCESISKNLSPSICKLNHAKEYEPMFYRYQDSLQPLFLIGYQSVQSPGSRESKLKLHATSFFGRVKNFFTEKKVENFKNQRENRDKEKSSKIQKSLEVMSNNLSHETLLKELSSASSSSSSSSSTSKDNDGNLLSSSNGKERSIKRNGNRRKKNKGKKEWTGPFAYHEEVDIEIINLTNLGLGIGRVFALREEEEFVKKQGEEDTKKQQEELSQEGQQFEAGWQSQVGQEQEQEKQEEEEKEKMKTTTENIPSKAGWVIMVPNVIPGEKVRVRIFRNHNNYSEADLVEILAASPDRVEPKCPLAAECGGCQYQHMTIEKQREWKTQQVKELLTRLGGISFPSTTSDPTLEVKPIIGSDEIYHYRSKLTPHHESPNSQGIVNKIGFLKKGSRNLVDVTACPIATKGISDALPELREKIQNKLIAKLNDGSGRKPRAGTLFIRETDEGIITDSTIEVSQTVNGKTFHYLAGEFFQNNPYVLPKMVDYVLEKAKFYQPKYLVDAYCGVGLFSICGSEFFQESFGVEISVKAIELARKNAEVNNISNCKFLSGTSSNIFGKIQHLDGDETTMILDPPRKGCDEVFLNQLYQFKPKRVVYVSCDPATQARDTASFLTNQHQQYRIVEIQPLDLFPMTRHIENVITFDRID